MLWAALGKVMVIKSLATWILSSSAQHYHSSRPKAEWGEKSHLKNKSKSCKIAYATLPFISPDSFLSSYSFQLNMTEKGSSVQKIYMLSSLCSPHARATQGSNFSRSLCFSIGAELTSLKNSLFSCLCPSLQEQSFLSYHTQPNYYKFYPTIPWFKTLLPCFLHLVFVVLEAACKTDGAHN